MFNLTGSEIVVILLLALIVLGPDKLPEAMRRAGRTWAQLRRMSDSFQDEVRKGFDEPTKELRDTANTVAKAAGFATKPVAATAAAVKKSLLDPAAKPFPSDPSDPAADSDASPTESASGEPTGTASGEPADTASSAVEPSSVEPSSAEPLSDLVAGDGPMAVADPGDPTPPATS